MSVRIISYLLILLLSVRNSAVYSNFRTSHQIALQCSIEVQFSVVVKLRILNHHNFQSILHICESLNAAISHLDQNKKTRGNWD